MPRHAPVTQPRPLEATRVATPVAADAVRRFRSPAHGFPHAAFLSNGNYVVDRHQCRRRRESLPRPRRHAGPPRRDARSGQPVHLPARCPHRVGLVGHGTAHARRARGLPRHAGAGAGDVPARRRRHRDEPGNRRLARRRRRSAPARRSSTAATACARSKSPATRRSCCRRRPRTSRTRRSASCSSKRNSGPIARRCSAAGGPAASIPTRSGPFHVLSLEGRPQGAARMRNRPQPLSGPRARPGRPRGARWTFALEYGRRDARSDRQPAAAGAARAGRVRAAVVRHRHGVEPRNRDRAGAEIPRPSASARTFALASTHAHSTLRHLGISSDDALQYERLASRVLYLDGSLRVSPDVQAKNTLGQQALWAHSISGDLPDPARPRRRPERAAAHPAGARSAGVLAAEGPQRGHRHPERAPGRATSTRCTSTSRRCSRTDRGGPGRIGRAASISSARIGCRRRERTLLLGRRARRPARRPRHAGQPARSAYVRAGRRDRPRGAGRDARRPRASRDAPAQLETPPLRLFNGIGGFSADGKEYVVVLDGNRETPLPWVNVIANPAFGTIVSASGSAFTWAENSRENRLTPFWNDPVTDPTGEALFIRDDETGDAWSPTPGPMRRTPSSGRHRHSPRRRRHHVPARRVGIDHDLKVFVAPSAPVKFSLLTLTNRSQSPRRLSIFSYSEWVLGPPKRRSAVACQDGARRGVRRVAGAQPVQRRLLRAASHSPTPARPRVGNRPTARRSSAAMARWRSRRRSAASRCPSASARDSIRAPRCMSPSRWLREKRARWSSCSARAPTWRRCGTWFGSSAASRQPRPPWTTSVAPGTKASAPSRFERLTIRST